MTGVRLPKIVLAEFHKARGLDLPDWIDMISDGNQFEDAEVEEEEIVRGFFKNKINNTYSRNYKSIVSWEDQKDDTSINKNKTMESRLNFCQESQLISFMRRKNTNSSEILITIDILKEFRDADISSIQNFTDPAIQNFTDLARLLGGDMKPTKVDLKTTRPIIISIAKFINFIDKDPSE